MAPGDYNFGHWYASFNSNPSRRLSGNVAYEWGSFWNGYRKGLRLSMSYHPHYRIGLTARYNRDELQFGKTASDSHLVALRVNYSFSMKMFLNALVQYNSDLREVSSNLRFNLIHPPLSDIFIVYNELRDTFQGGAVDKVLSIKYTHMLDF